MKKCRYVNNYNVFLRKERKGFDIPQDVFKRQTTRLSFHNLSSSDTFEFLDENNFFHDCNMMHFCKEWVLSRGKNKVYLLHLNGI